jgi:hypothetical protein
MSPNHTSDTLDGLDAAAAGIIAATPSHIGE